jgi:flagellar biosynthesis/type III secretory pathway protein FliH
MTILESKQIQPFVMRLIDEIPAKGFVPLGAPVPPRPKILPPSFSEEELMKAREEGYVSGRESGLTEGKSVFLEATQQLKNAISNLDKQIEAVFNAQQQSWQNAEKRILELSSLIARKVAGDTLKHDLTGHLNSVVKPLLQMIVTEPVINISLHSSLAGLMSENIRTMGEELKYSGKINIVTDDKLPVTDCAIRWEQGGADVSTSDLWEKIQNTLGTKIEAPEICTPAEPVQEEQGKIDG